MQPNPTAETSKLLFPSLRFFIFILSLQLNVQATLPRLGTAVAHYLASTVVILRESAGWMRHRIQREDATKQRRKGNRETREPHERFPLSASNLIMFHNFLAGHRWFIG